MGRSPRCRAPTADCPWRLRARMLAGAQRRVRVEHVPREAPVELGLRLARPSCCRTTWPWVQARSKTRSLEWRSRTSRRGPARGGASRGRRSRRGGARSRRLELEDRPDESGDRGRSPRRRRGPAGRGLGIGGRARARGRRRDPSRRRTGRGLAVDRHEVDDPGRPLRRRARAAVPRFACRPRRAPSREEVVKTGGRRRRPGREHELGEGRQLDRALGDRRGSSGSRGGPRRRPRARRRSRCTSAGRRRAAGTRRAPAKDRLVGGAGLRAAGASSTRRRRREVAQVAELTPVIARAVLRASA